MKFVEILLGILLFPLMLILGLVLGVIRVYEIFHNSFITATYKDENI